MGCKAGLHNRPVSFRTDSEFPTPARWHSRDHFVQTPVIDVHSLHTVMDAADDHVGRQNQRFTRYDLHFIGRLLHANS